MPQKQIESGVLHRFFDVDMRKIDTDARTVQLSFSSETPVDRWFGVEVLDHDLGSVRLDRIRNGGALLVDHDTRDQVGVIEQADIDTDRRGKALVRFGNSSRAAEIFQDVQEGIRRHVSVGYRIHKMVMEETGDDVDDTYRAIDWEPYELSIVSVPADPSVGVGRSDEGPKRTITVELTESLKQTQEERTMSDAQQSVETNVDQAVETQPVYSIDAEEKRTEAIEKLGKMYGATDDVIREFILGDKEPAEFRAFLHKKLGEVKPSQQRDADIGMSDADADRFSFVRVMHALANPQDRRAQQAAAFEFEASRAAQDRIGQSAKGVMVPADVMKRDLSVGTDTAGGHTVATDLLSGSFIELLRNRLVVDQLGSTMLTDLVGNIAIPRQTSGATAYWIGTEGGAVTESQQAFDQVTLAPKTVGAYTDYTRQLLLQSSIDVENFVRGDLARVLAIAIDLAALYGSGSSGQPTGVSNTGSINTTTFAAADPTYVEIVAMESAVAADNADVGTLGYAMDATMRGAMKTTEKASGTAQFVWESGGTVNGYNTGVSNQVTDGDVFFGNWADLLIGMWGGLDLTVDPYSLSTTGTVRIVALQSMDIAVRHPVSFCYSNDGV